MRRFEVAAMFGATRAAERSLSEDEAAALLGNQRAFDVAVAQKRIRTVNARGGDAYRFSDVMEERKRLDAAGFYGDHNPHVARGVRSR